MNSSSPFAIREHDESALGAGGVDRRVHHEHEHFLEHARRAQPAEPIEQGRQRAKVDDAGRVADMRIGRIVREKNQLGAAAAAEANLVAMAQRPLGNLLVVDERAASRPAILQHEPPVFEPHDFGVLARNVGADRAQIALALAADAEDRFVDDDDAAAERILDLEARNFRGDGVRHGQMGFALSAPISRRKPVKS